MWAIRSITLALSCAPLLVSACIPYTVATTAAPIPVGEMRHSTVMFVTPLVDGRENETPPQWSPGLDHEMRFGVNARSDFGIRITSFSGLVFNYKRLLSDSSSRVLVAVMPGAGFVNLLQHDTIS